MGILKQEVKEHFKILDPESAIQQVVEVEHGWGDMDDIALTEPKMRRLFLQKENLSIAVSKVPSSLTYVMLARGNATFIPHKGWVHGAKKLPWKAEVILGDRKNRTEHISESCYQNRYLVPAYALLAHSLVKKGLKDTRDMEGKTSVFYLNQQF